MFTKHTLQSIGLVATLLISTNSFSQQKELTVQEMLSGRLPAGILSPLPTIGGWTDGSHYIITNNNQQQVVHAKSGTAKPYTPTIKQQQPKASVYSKSNDLYYKNAAGQERRLTNDEAKELHPDLSPDGNYVAYTKNHDLYTYDLQNNKEIRITTDGSDLILNGYSSWVYMEEILGRSTQHKAFWWSGDGKNIAFFRSDDTKVPLFMMSDATGVHGYVEQLRYPKAGDTNPEVQVGIVKPAGGQIVWADFNAKEDQYFGTPFWLADGKTIWQTWMDRDQQQLKVFAIDTENGSKKLIYEEFQQTWIDLDNNSRFTFLADGKTFILQSDKSGWNMLYLHDMNGKLLNPITDGEFTVTKINHIDEKHKVVYFTARKENTARLDLYSVKLNGKDLKRLTFGDYNHQINLSPDGSYFITVYQNASTPSKMAVVDNKGKILHQLGDAKGPAYDNYKFSKTELIRVKSDDGLYNLPVLITYPKNFDPAKKYPVLISIYGGPNAGTVMDRFSLNGQTQFMASEGLIQVAMDHRASGHFGKKGQNFIHRNLGYWEMKDYSTIVGHLIKHVGADPSKICITGFSYGGYLSCYALTYGAGVFTHAMAGGSVTDWKFYDTHYTERYMDTPKDNPEGYKASSTLTHADKYKGKLLIVHGIIDENVHLQNTIQLTDKLQELGKNFDMMLYSNSRHGWGGNKGTHFERLKLRFIYENLLQKELPVFFGN